MLVSCTYLKRSPLNILSLNRTKSKGDLPIFRRGARGVKAHMSPLLEHSGSVYASNGPNYIKAADKPGVRSGEEPILLSGGADTGDWRPT